MKKLLCFALLLGLLFSLSGCQEAAVDDRVTINVYNWGQYISEGDDGCIDVIAEFEKAYPNIRVNYVIFDSNETMYTKMAGGGITVDVIIPSDYMVGRLISENMLLPLDFANIPNAANIDPNFQNPSYDPEGKYSVPYAWGTVGIIYNTKYVDPQDVESQGWKVLWDKKYADKILMFDNSRDAFAIAQCILGYDMNTTDKTQLQACAQLLEQQRPVVQQYIMDQVFDLMENEEAWLAPYYAGDYLTMADENENLAFYLPQEQGFNLFTDAMCIPTCAEHKAEAETFINFLCDPEIAGGNMDWICYSTPLSEESGVKEYMDPEMAYHPVSYPDDQVLAKGTGYLNLPRETTRYMDSLFMKVRNGISLEDSESSATTLWLIIAPAVILVSLAAWLLLKKKKRKK